MFGLTTFNGQEHLAESIESLLRQTRDDLAIVVVDDGSTDRTAAIAGRYAELDPRVSYVRNDNQLGLVRNWRRALRLAAERFPEAPYFAWASDHDLWHPEWLETLAAELDEHPEAVLAYPVTVRIDDAGSEYPTRTRLFDTAGETDRELRLRRVAGGMRNAGEMIYGLMRRDALERAGPFPLVVLPDRLQLLRLALEGEFRQVERRLWYRRYRAGVVMTNSRQRATSFPDGAPLAAYLPWWLTHSANFGRGRLGALVLHESARTAWDRARERGRRKRRWRRRERRVQLRQRLERSPVPTAAAPPPDPPPPELDPRILEDLPPDATAGVDLLAAGPDEVARRLYESGVDTLYVVERESPELRIALARRYWLRDVWVPEAAAPGRKPDPTTGPVPRVPGGYRHVVGWRRLAIDDG